MTTYIISYNANGGTNAPDPQTKEQSVTLILSTQRPTKYGYIFLGWSESISSNPEYNAGGQFTKDQNTTLYAVWTPAPYTLKFSSNNGSGSMSSLDCEYDKNITLPKCLFTRIGFKFAGWLINKDKFYFNGSYISINTIDPIFYLNANTDVLNKYGYNIIAALTHYSTQGNTENREYTYTDINDTKRFIPDGATVKNLSQIIDTYELKAQWQPIEYTLIYNGNGDDSGINITEPHLYTDSITISECTCNRTGYSFIGWCTDKDGDGIWYRPGDIVEQLSSVDGDIITLYAQWEGIYPNCWIKVNGKWKLGIAYIKDKNQWNVGNTRIKDDNIWKG